MRHVSEKETCHFNSSITLAFISLFLQRGRIACNAECCISHGNSVCPSVCSSVRHTLVPSDSAFADHCARLQIIFTYLLTYLLTIQTDEDRIRRSSPWGSKYTLVFWYQQWLAGDVTFHLKFALKVTHHTLWKARTLTNICL